MSARDWFDFLVARGPWLSRLFVDYRYWVFVSLSFILLLASVRFYLGDRNLIEIARSAQFVAPLAVLFCSWILTYYILYWPRAPRDDGLVHVTVADFGYEQKAVRLQEQVSTELEKHLSLFENVGFQPQAVRETVSDDAKAEKLARARGFHLIIFGKAELLDEKKYLVHATLLQVNPYKRIQLGKFVFQRQADLSSLDELRTLAKDMAVKVLRTCDQNYLLALTARHNRISFSKVIGGERRATFNVGSNITQKFLLGDMSDGRAFLEGSVSPEGEPLLSGRIFDSDGKLFFTIQDNQIIQPDQGFSVQRRGESFAVRDRYDRILLEYKVEEKQRFLDRYVNAERRQMENLRKSLESERGIRIPFKDQSRETRETVSGFGRIVTINGEIYREDGLLGVILSDEELYQYALQSLQF